MVSSRVYPGLERKPGGPDNWVEEVGGLPPYMERIAKHLHYEKGMSISHAIATAKNTLERWKHKGGVVKYGDPQHRHVTLVTAAAAQKDLALWAAKLARYHAMHPRTSGATTRHGRVSLSSNRSRGTVDLAVLAKRANAIKDPAMRAEARAKVIDLALPAKQKCEYCGDPATKRVLHSEGMAYIPCCDMHLDKAKEAAMLSAPDGTRDPSNINKIMDMSSSEWIAGVIDLALTKDGRKSFKNTGGKFKHGFIPLDNTAKVAKAKGSPIAMKRMNRLFGGASAGAKGAKKFLTKKPKRAKPGIQVGIRAKKTTGTERVQDVGQSQRLEVRDATKTQKVKPAQLEASRGRRPTKRSNQRWEDLQESEKTVRNGKRYVLTTYNGRQSLTEWIGPDNNADVVAPDKRDKVMTNITPGDLKKLTTAALRRMLEQPNVSPAMRKLLNAELNRKEKLGLVGGKTR